MRIRSILDRIRIRPSDFKPDPDPACYRYIIVYVIKVNYWVKQVGSGTGSGFVLKIPDPTKKVRIRLGPDPQHWLQILKEVKYRYIGVGGTVMAALPETAHFPVSAPTPTLVFAPASEKYR